MRARRVRPRDGQSILDFAWSSVAGGCALPRGKRARGLATASGFFACGVEDTTAGRRQFVERFDRRAMLGEVSRCGVAALEKEVDAPGAAISGAAGTGARRNLRSKCSGLSVRRRQRPNHGPVHAPPNAGRTAGNRRSNGCARDCLPQDCRKRTLPR